MIALALLLAGAAGEAPSMSTCVKDGAEISGEMRWVESRHVGNKSDLRYPFLVLDKLSCFDTADGRAFGRWVQLALSRAEMKALVPGDTLTVKAKFMIPASAYHIGDVLASDVVIVSQSPP